MSRDRRSGAIAYVPALDGLRAICVLAVLGFHAGLDGVRGGYLGVSTFFTLSGYLVTTILFAGLEGRRAEGASAPRVDVREFWRRRLRRLVPASVATLVLVVAAAPWMLGPEAQARLGADVVASLLYVVNWRFVQGEYAYALIFTAPSLVQHYWSLAIEGQLYVVLPLLVAAAARAAAPRRAFGVLAGALLVLGLLESFVLGADPQQHDRIYYGTDTRAPELLAGALLALALPARPGARVRATSRAAELVSWLALGAMLVAFSRVPLASDALHRGGLAAFAGLSSVVVAACVRGGSLSRVLGWGPLVWVGRVSYGAYLFHWPIYLALDAWLEQPSPWLRLTLGGGLTLLVAGASNALLETPIRRGRGWPGRRPIAATAAAIAGVVLLVGARLPAAGVVAEVRESVGMDASSAAAAPGDADDRAAVRVAVFGDSVAYSFSGPLRSWLHGRPAARWVRGWCPIGCGLLLPDFVQRGRQAGENVDRWLRGRLDGFTIRADCLEVPARVAERLDAGQPDLAISVSSVWDLAGLPDEGRDGRRPLGDPTTDERLRRVLDARVALLASRGATVAWMDLPAFRPAERFPLDEASAERARRHYDELLRELPARHPGRVVVVDLAGYVERWPAGPFDPALREDGLHFTAEGVHALLDAGLGDELVALAREARRRRDLERDAVGADPGRGAATRTGMRRASSSAAASAGTR